jgi:hypothetical protein
VLGDGLEQSCKPSMMQCYFCGGTSNFKIIANANEMDSIHSRTGLNDMHIISKKKVNILAGLIFML